MARPRIVIGGAGFAGYHAARTLSRLARDRAESVVINPTGYFLYLPLLHEVAGGLLEARRVTVSVPETVPGVRLILGEITEIDLAAQQVRWVGPEDRRGQVGYDRLVIAAGSVNKLLPIPGVTEHAHGLRGLPEALYLRDESYGQGRRRPYEHHDRGRAVDLGGREAAANPFGIPLTGLPAKAVTRAYHLLALPGNRVRTAADWTVNAVMPRQAVQLGLLPPQAVPLDASPELPAWSAVGESR